MYIPPQNSPREKRLKINHYETLQNDINKFASLGEIILCGDFNARSGHLQDSINDFHLYNNSSSPVDHRNSQDSHINVYGRSLAELCCGNSLITLNGRSKGDFVGKFTCHTYNGSSVVDYTIVSQNLFSSLSHFSVSSLTEFSHHSFLSFALKAETPDLSGDSSIELTSHPIAFKWNEHCREVLLDIFNSDEVNDHLDTLLNPSNDNDLDINSLVNDFTEIITKASRKCIPLKKQKKKSSKTRVTQKQKWFDNNCYRLKRELRNLGKLISTQPNDPFIRHMFFTKKKEYKKLIRKLKRKFHSETLNKINSIADSNPKEFWNLVNKIKSSHSNCSNTISHDEWFHYFQDLNKINFSSDETRVEAQIVKDFRLWANTSDEILDKPISLQEIYNISRKLKHNKASSSDLLNNEIIKTSITSLAPYYVKLFNTILSSGVFPRIWSEGFITPIHKSGSKTEPGNYRGICVSSCLGKFFTLILNTRLNNFLEENNILNNYQIGFRHGFRTSDHLLVLKTLIDSYKSSRKPIFTCFIDFRKAYDSVWREGLFFKLIKYGCSKKFVAILLNMYSSVKSAVKLEQGVTPFFQSHIGVKQGCNLSPTLFNIFINDIPNLFNSHCDPVKLDDTELSCLLYADDLVIMSESESGLQRCLHNLETYTKKWKLQVNLKKSKILIFGTQSKRRLFLSSKWYFGDKQLECVDEYTYLGLTFHYTGNFKIAIASLYNKALRAYYCLMDKLSNVENIPIKTLLKLFSSVVIPVLLYGCEIWGVCLLGRISSYELFQKKLFSIVNKLESLQLKFFKRILGVHSKSTNLAIYGELGRVPLIVQISTLATKYWLRIKTPSYINTLVGKAARFNIRSNSQAITFINYILKVSDLRSLDHIYLELESLKNLGKYIKNRLVDYFTNYWKGQFQESRSNGKLRTLVQVKNNFRFEEYLHVICNVKHRQAITKLRISAHKLPVESGRYNKTPYNERKCTLCQSDEIGDEFHYLMSCPNNEFVKLRNTFVTDICKINSSFRSIDTKNLFLYILNVHDKSIMKIISIYFHDTLAMYDSLL